MFRFYFTKILFSFPFQKHHLGYVHRDVKGKTCNIFSSLVSNDASFTSFARQPRMCWWFPRSTWSWATLALARKSPDRSTIWTRFADRRRTHRPNCSTTIITSAGQSTFGPWAFCFSSFSLETCHSRRRRFHSSDRPSSKVNVWNYSK